MINGGLHGAGNLDFQEFQVVPASAKPYSEALQSSVEVYYMVEESLKRRGAIHSVGDEGGFAPNLFTNADALSIYLEAISNAGYEVGKDFFLGLDVAADTFYKNGLYSIRDNSQPFNASSFTSFFEELNEQYRLLYLEDPLYQDDWDGWQELTRRLGNKLLIVGDDLLATNPQRVAKAVEQKAVNSILVKPNQIGTITETLDVIKTCRQAGWKIIVSHRSGETNDFFIADFAVGVLADYVKFGAPARGERVAKYNRLLSIEAELSQ
jgi:enolase